MSNALLILRNLAKEKIEQSNKTLGVARKELQASQDRLIMVQGYREQYQMGMTERAKQGLTGQQIQQQQQFIERLDQAIGKQLKETEFREKALDTALAEWRAAQAEEKKYQALLDRAALALMHKESKRDQKSNDEYAARIHRVSTGAY